MKERLNRRERLKLSSIAFMKALKPKINSSKKQKEQTAHRSSSILLGKMEKNLSRYPGTI